MPSVIFNETLEGYGGVMTFSNAALYLHFHFFFNNMEQVKYK